MASSCIPSADFASLEPTAMKSSGGVVPEDQAGHLLNALASADEADGSLLIRFVAEFEPDAFVTAVAQHQRFDLIDSSDGPVSYVHHGVDRNDRSARTDNFDFHNDGLYLDRPPDFCALYCLDSGRGDMPTVFVDSRHVLEKLSHSGISLALLSQLQQVYVDRRGERRCYRLIRQHPRFGASVLQYFDGEGQLVTADKPVNGGFGDSGLTEIKHAIHCCIEECEPTSLHWSRGDFLVWDNYSYLHARKSLKADSRRRLARFWLRKAS